MNGASAARRRVLVVDSDVDFRANISDYLSMQDDMIVVGAVGDGVEALLTAKRSRPDVIVIDSMLPLLDGVGLFRHLREQNRGGEQGAACIFLVNDGQDAVLREIIGNGADYCMVKPVNLSELAYRIRRAAEDVSPQKNVYRRIAAQVLRDMQMRVNDDGFEYAERAAAILLESTGKKPRFKAVYIRVAEETAGFCMDAGKYVENDIRNAIKRMHAQNAPFYREVMGLAENDEKCPTNGVVLESVVQYIRVHHNLP